jgi:membrane protease YdiL (CAAX protease family)
MKGIPKLGRVEIPIFFALCLFAWVIWGPQAAFRYGYLGWALSLQSPLNAITVWSPGLAAILLTGLTLGKSQAGALFRPLLLWRVAMKWYIVAILFEPTKWLLAFAFDRVMGQTYQLGTAPLFRSFGAAAAFMIPVAIVFTLPNSLGEEIGWRTFALPRLQQSYGALVASVVIGLFWGFWHIPMWLAWSKSDLSWLSLILMILNMVPVAVMFTWLYNKTSQSLLLVCIFHASMAAKGYLLPRLPSLTESAIFWLNAIAVVVFGGIEISKAEADMGPSQN